MRWSRDRCAHTSFFYRQPIDNHGRPVHPLVHWRTFTQPTHTVSHRSYQTVYSPRALVLGEGQSWLHLPEAVSNLAPQQLNVEKDEVEELLIGLILEGKVDGRIDQVSMRLELDRQCVSFILNRSVNLSVLNLSAHPVKAWKRSGTRLCRNGRKHLRVSIRPSLERMEAAEALRVGLFRAIHSVRCVNWKGGGGHRNIYPVILPMFFSAAILLLCFVMCWDLEARILSDCGPALYRAAILIRSL